MPKINVYVPDDLATLIKDKNLHVSKICQQALRDAALKDSLDISERVMKIEGITFLLLTNIGHLLSDVRKTHDNST